VAELIGGDTGGVPLLFDELAATSEAVAATSKRNDKVAAFAEVLRRLDPNEVVDAVAFLTGQTAIGRIGVGWAALREVRPAPATDPTLLVADVADVITRLAAMSGDGVVVARRDVLYRLLAAATEREQRLLRGILGGELRQGALEGVLATAVAKAAGVPVASVRRAAMMAGDLGPAAHAGLAGGVAALDAVRLDPLRPVQPMLASTATSATEAIEATGLASVEWKLDGARVQAHRRGSDIKLFTRNLNDITDRLPGVVETVRALPGGDLVLDGEAMGARSFFFDAMHLDGQSIHDEPLSVRRDLLHEFVPAEARLPSIITADAVEAERFMSEAVRLGHEGVMVKGIEEPYQAGRRGKSWRKVKPVHTLDLVVIAVEWGHGRRTGKLSNLHLAARIGAGVGAGGGGFVMVGKTFKGLTDEILAWQTERFLGLEIGRGVGRDGHVVHVEPVQVVEIAVDGVQVSTRYPGGVALRFARVKGYRHDKLAADADQIAAVQALLR
jgi:DNA ligase-1